LVDLLLVLGKGEGDLGVLDRERHLRGDRVLVQGNRNAAEDLRGADRGVKARTVVADQREVLAALEALFGKTGGERAHLVGIALPGPGLPDAEILLADSRPRAAHAC